MSKKVVRASKVAASGLTSIVKAGFFDVEGDEGLAAKAVAACTVFVSPAEGEPLEVPYQETRYQLTNWAWDKDEGVATATIWRVREKNLPSSWDKGKGNPVSTPLAEGTSFAYLPSLGRAVVQYNHHGPRHRVMGFFLEKIGLPGPLRVLPKLNKNELEKLRHGATVGRFQYTLSDIVDVEGLRGAGVGDSISQMEAVHGVSISVSIRLKRNKKGEPTNTAEHAKSLITKLATLPGVRTLRASYKPTEESRMEMLDLLRGHKSLEIDVSDDGRQLNHMDCRARLQNILAKAWDTDGVAGNGGIPDAARQDSSEPHAAMGNVERTPQGGSSR